MRLLAMLTVACCALTAAAQDFQLRSPSGELTGPFRFREGEALQVGTNTASVVNVRSQANRILDAMQAIRIPEVDFRQANLRDVITFLVKHSQEFSADRRGVTVILKLDDWTPPVYTDCFCANSNGIPVGDPLAADTNHVHAASTEIPLITFSALDITLKEALDYAVDIAGCKYSIRDGAVVIMHRNAPEGPIVVRLYDVLSSSIYRLRDIGSSMRQNQQGAFNKLMGPRAWVKDEDDLNLKSFFEEMGVPWPTGSYIKYVHGLDKLTVANTEENLAIFEDCLAMLNVHPYQIEIELAILAFDRQPLAELGPDGVSTAALTALWTSGQAELLAAPRVLTQSGQAAAIKGCSEYIYPTEFGVSSIGGDTNTNSTAAAFMIEPQDFATREVGVIVEVTPEISPDGNLISISLSPEFTEAPVWEQFGGTFVDADGKAHQINMPQPYFHTYKETSNVLVTNGKRLLIGGGIPSRDGQRLIYMLLTARKVGTDGEPLR